MKWKKDLVCDIRTFTEYDDLDYDQNDFFKNYISSDNCKEVTECNRSNLLDQFLKVKDYAKAILEIGVARNDEESFVHVLTSNKRHETIYIGLNHEDRSFIRDPDNNIHTIQNNSLYIDENMNMFNEFWGIKKFDFIFIDGWHSINQVLSDWEYTKLLAPNGIVGLHDTTCHPGPNKFINNLDKTRWDVIENACPQDWGIGFARKKRYNKFIEVK